MSKTRRKVSFFNKIIQAIKTMKKGENNFFILSCLESALSIIAEEAIEIIDKEKKIQNGEKPKTDKVEKEQKIDNSDIYGFPTLEERKKSLLPFLKAIKKIDNEEVDEKKET